MYSARRGRASIRTALNAGGLGGRNAMEASPTARYWISTHTRHMLSGSATYNTP